MELAMISAYLQHNFYLHYILPGHRSLKRRNYGERLASTAGHLHDFGDFCEREIKSKTVKGATASSSSKSELLLLIMY